jgi:hypothetical protein
MNAEGKSVAVSGKRFYTLKGGISMAEKGKSKTDVSARAEAKGRIQRCSVCGNKVEVVLAVSASGKKRMKRVCCGG